MFLTTILSFVLFTGFVGLVTWLITRKDNHRSSTGYFLAGRSLTFPLIAGSLLLTNLSTEQLVGLNGLAFSEGLSVLAWEIVAVVALVAMALFFLPRFLKSGIATLPQLLEIRFDKQTAMITNFIFLIAYMVILMPIILYSGAQGLSNMLNLSGLLGIQNDTAILWITVWFVGIVGSIYALWGGLRTVVVSDTLNGIGLLIGGLLIPYFAFNLISDGQGIMEGWRILKTAHPEMINSVGKSTQNVPFFTLFTGVMIINLFYWCTNQQIIQRTFGASSLAEGQKGVLLTGTLKLLGPLYLVIPGLIAFYLYNQQGIKADNAYGTLVRQVLPAPLTGFFAAVMVGAILSSFNSALNSTCTLFSLGFYKEILRKNATDEQVVKSGKWFGLFLAIGAMTIAPFLAKTESIFAYLQKMNGIYFIPIFAVVVVGLLSKRVPAIAARAALLGGVSIIAAGYFIPGCDTMVEYLHEYHFLTIVFVGLIVAMLIWGKLAPREEAWIQQDVKAVDLTPWKWAVPTGILLCIIVCIIYYTFADFGVL
ncbi:MAG: solute:sodium symporter family transporter [Victivallaceae bacterium]|nr:solute:sodium symporter family transporter [Victivallaceae bacterium]